MRKKIAVAVLLALAAPAIWLGFSGNEGGEDYGLGFGKQFAGGWLMTADLGSPVEVLVSLSADGGVTMNSTLRPAGPNNTGGWLNTRYNTTSHGTWKRTGPKSFETITLMFVQDNDGNTVMYEKVMMQLTLTVKGGLDGSGRIHMINAGNDPLDAEAPVAFDILVPSLTARPVR